MLRIKINLLKEWLLQHVKRKAILCGMNILIFSLKSNIIYLKNLILQRKTGGNSWIVKVTLEVLKSKKNFFLLKKKVKIRNKIVKMN